MPVTLNESERTDERIKEASGRLEEMRSIIARFSKSKKQLEVPKPLVWRSSDGVEFQMANRIT